MLISSSVEISNFSRDEFSETNSYSDFKRRIFFDFIPSFADEVKCEIALTFFQLVVFKPTSGILKKADFKVLSKHNIDLVRVCLPNCGLLNTNDACVREFDSDINASKSFQYLQYFPISLKRYWTLNVQLLDGKGNKIKLAKHMPNYPDNLNYFVLCHFHIKTMSLFDVKCLRLYSNEEKNKPHFADNRPDHFTSLISPLFHDDDDFTKWEVALQSVMISKMMMRHFKDATQLNVRCGSNCFYDTLSDINSQNLRSFALPQKLNRRTTTCLEVNMPIYFTVTKRLLDELSVELHFYNGPQRIILNEQDITDEMYSRVTLLFKRKYMLNMI